jgi:putative hydrolases of HD superfamily
MTFATLSGCDMESEVSKLIESRDAEFLYEIGTMRHISRTWHQFGGIGFANVAEHSLRVAMIAMILAESEGADGGRAMQMALIHDVPETRTGDVNYVSRMYVDRYEGRAMKELAQKTSIQNRLLELWEEFEEQGTLEARIVKDADMLDVDFDLMERAHQGSNIRESLVSTRDRLHQKLYTESARTLYEQLCATNPHAWHLHGTNRVTAGDWKE